VEPRTPAPAATRSASASAPAGPRHPPRHDPDPGRHQRQLRRLPALNNLNLYIGVGELRCIIGPNGAGKTTLMDVITGKTRPDTARPGSAKPST
jgi:ABC-type multidrug transport system fused ATPase/permease subunit